MKDLKNYIESLVEEENRKKEELAAAEKAEAVKEENVQNLKHEIAVRFSDSIQEIVSLIEAEGFKIPEERSLYVKEGRHGYPFDLYSGKGSDDAEFRLMLVHIELDDNNEVEDYTFRPMISPEVRISPESLDNFCDLMAGQMAKYLITGSRCDKTKGGA